MGLASFFGFTSAGSADELPETFPLSISQTDFVAIDVFTIYQKILTDVVERTHGIKEVQLPLLWDNCLKSEKNKGLVSMLAEAMTSKKELFLIYDPGTKVVREATSEEQSVIRTDYKERGESKTGVFVSFQQYRRTDMVKIYSALEYCTVDALNKSMGLAKAIQMKISDLRGSVSLADQAEAKSQALLMSKALQKGQNVYMDAKDIIETADPKTEAAEKAMLLMNQKRAHYLSMPASYITGEQTASGLSDTGKSDEKAVDRGLKVYYFSIVKPVFEALFNIKTTYKSGDLSQISQGLETLKTFELTSPQFISDENKNKIVNKLFDLPEDAKGDQVDTTELPPGNDPLNPKKPGEKTPPPDKKE